LLGVPLIQLSSFGLPLKQFRELDPVINFRGGSGKLITGSKEFHGELWRMMREARKAGDESVEIEAATRIDTRAGTHGKLDQGHQLIINPAQ
jgi:hypothetical protein